MTFREWLHANFGEKAPYRPAARYLGTSPSNVYAWANYLRWPRPKHLELIENKTGGQVCIQSWSLAFAALERARQKGQPQRKEGSE